jgi:hypothetical protein
VSERHPEAPQEREAATLRERLSNFKKEIERCDLAEGLVQSRAWSEFLEPMLYEHVTAFEECLYSLDEKDLPRVRLAAQVAKSIKDSVLTRIGKKEEYEKQAQRLSGLLAEAEAKGLIAKGVVE